MDVPFAELKTEEMQNKLRALKEDPVLFCETFFLNRQGTSWHAFSYQAEIMRDKHKKKLIVSSRQIGKSECVCMIAIHRALTRPRQQILIISRSQEQSSELLFRIQQIIMGSKLKTSIRSSSFRKILIDNGSKIISLPTSEATVRGYSPDVVILDESAQFEADEIFYEAIEPMLTFTKGDLILLSSPKGRRGFFYEMYLQWQHNPNAMVWVLPAIKDGKAICPEFDLGDINKKREDFEKIGRSNKFRQEYMAEFVDDAGAFFPYELILPCVKGYPVIHEGASDRSYWMGVDWGQVNDATVIIIVEKDQHENLKVVFWKKFEKEDYIKICNHISYLCSRFAVSRIIADLGSGRAQVDELSARGLPVEGFAFSYQSKIDLFAFLRQMFEKQKIIIPDHTELIEQLNMFTAEVSKAGRMLLHHREGQHDDFCDALALAVWATGNAGYASFTAV
jgi:phage FluMu gp28-like protein